MKLKLAAIVGLFMLIAFPHASAYAEDGVGESVDWLTIARPSIAIEKVVGSDLADRTRENELAIRTNIVVSLKGAPPQDVTFIRRWSRTAVPGQDDTARPYNGTEYLMFFDDKGNVTNAINLNFPSKFIGVGANPKDVALSNDFGILKTRESILDIVQRRLAKMAKAPGTVVGGKKIGVPLNTPAWNVLYTGNDGYLIIPDPAQDKATQDGAQPIAQKAEFSGLALVRDCGYLPKNALEIKSAIQGKPHTLSISCEQTTEQAAVATRLMTLMFRFVDIVHEADYEFRWGYNPDARPGDHKGFFTAKPDRCDKLKQIIQFRVKHFTAVKPADSSIPNDHPMYAEWHADCVADEIWGTVMKIVLSVRSGVVSTDSNPPAATPPSPQAEPATVH